jgi:hypothetical protein
MPTLEIQMLQLLGISTPADLRSYLHIREYKQVFGIVTLIGHANGKAWMCREFPDSTTIMVVNQGKYLNFKFDKTGQMTLAHIVKDL